MFIVYDHIYVDYQYNLFFTHLLLINYFALYLEYWFWSSYCASIMQINAGETRTLSGVIKETINMASNSTVILNNVTLNGYIVGDNSTTVICRGKCVLKGNNQIGKMTEEGFRHICPKEAQD